LLQHLLDTHHATTKTELERLRPLTKKVLAAHGDKHPELERVAALFEALDADLIAHLRKEELVLFPYMRDLEKRGRDATSPFGPISNPLAVMDEEHDMVCGLLRNLRQATKDYAPPADGCESFRALYTGLEALETDLRRHIHLENNLLFPAALELEARYGVAT
jgi:regulator of cell morphogenesis and NO signaling